MSLSWQNNTQGFCFISRPNDLREYPNAGDGTRNPKERCERTKLRAWWTLEREWISVQFFPIGPHWVEIPQWLVFRLFFQLTSQSKEIMIAVISEHKLSKVRCERRIFFKQTNRQSY
jgi:hypothetical protein